MPKLLPACVLLLLVACGGEESAPYCSTAEDDGWSFAVCADGELAECPGSNLADLVARCAPDGRPVCLRRRPDAEGTLFPWVETADAPVCAE